MWHYFYNNKPITEEESNILAFSKDENGKYRTMFAVHNDKKDIHWFYIFDN